ncbi:histone H2B type 1-A-like [Argiope bruennichi]|uniref:histone H2B type 1-A-like n=1 Tax=Argiope bruennichi TaxID=94029 RepID=UPI002494B578|nr:histone H2B type 1-A-like [Argiope bruennichi]
MVSWEKTYFKIEDKPSTSTSFNNFKAVQKYRKRKQRNEELSFKPYILRMKKLKAPDMELSSKALEDLDNLITSVFQKYFSELKLLTRLTKKKTLSINDVEAATKLCIPGKRKDNAVNYGRKIALAFKS